MMLFYSHFVPLMIRIFSGKHIRLACRVSPFNLDALYLTRLYLVRIVGTVTHKVFHLPAG